MASSPDRSFGNDRHHRVREKSCADTIRSRALLASLDVPYEFVDVEADPARWATAESISGRASLPVIVFPDGSHQVEPVDGDLRDRLARLRLI
ncbi:glutaredoxin family protein [Micromonospora sp. WMMD558]|uniref:glutaredoxin family protein n=1 Tax=Micromonospora sp. WMMD558 TaxID=3403462 RepID=UPI003BF50D6C